MAEETNAERGLREFGHRIRRLRVKSRLSVREAATLTGLDKNTILRLEAGEPSRASTRARICAAYGVFNLDPSELGQRQTGTGWAAFRPELSRWHRTRLSKPSEPSSVATDEAMQAAGERHRQGTLGLANQFFALLACDRPEGAMKAMVLEVYGPSGLARQTSGEAFIYVLSGTIRFRVGDETFDVVAGGAATFDRTLPHSHEPAPGPPKPTVMLYVQTA